MEAVIWHWLSEVPIISFFETPQTNQFCTTSTVRLAN